MTGPAVANAPSVVAAAWPEADALFRSDRRWRGSDDAYSVPLGGDRTLWLFGDTFVSPDAGPRAGAAFVRNTIGIQSGLDPARADIRFVWGATGSGSPSDFFGADGGTWLWPLDGILLGDRLLLFLMHVRVPARRPRIDPIEDWRTHGVLGFFEVFDWVALVVDHPDRDPAAWEPRAAARPSARSGIVLGAALIEEDGFLYAYGWRDKRLYLARWRAADAAAGDLSAPEWWGGCWRREGKPAAVIERGATELTVHRDARSGLLCQTQVVDLLDQSLGLRWAAEPAGPWTDPLRVYAPPEGARAGTFVYAGKAHPELEGADLVLTYASNAAVDVTLADESVYYPRFVRATFGAPA